MNKLLLSLIATATSLAAAAETFESGGIWYRTGDDNTVNIIAPPDGKPYSGKITVIPEVTHGGKTYTVTYANGFQNSQITEFTLAAGFSESNMGGVYLMGCKDLTRVNIGSYTGRDYTRLINLQDATDAAEVDVRERDGKTQVIIKKFELYDIDGTKLTPCMINDYGDDDKKYLPDANGVITFDGNTASDPFALTEFGILPLNSGYYVITLRAFNPAGDKMVNVRICPGLYQSGDYVTYDGLRYSLKNDKAYVFAPAEGSTYTGDIVIPSAITADGVQYTVSGIAKNAFSGTEITSVKFNRECEVAAYGFSGCPNLEYADMTACDRGLDAFGSFGYIFTDCPALKRIDGPRTAGKNYTWASYCPALETVTVAEGSQFDSVTSNCPAMYTSEIVDVTEQTVTLRVTHGAGGGVCTTDGTSLPFCIEVGSGKDASIFYPNANNLYTLPRELLKNSFGYFNGTISICYDNRTDTYLEVPVNGSISLDYITALTEEDLAGISDIAAPSDAAPAEYYDLHGRRLASPSQPGLYIRRQGTRAEKILIRR